MPADTISSGTHSGLTASFDTINVTGSGVIVSTTVLQSGLVFVYGGGQANTTFVSSGGTIIVDSAGLESGTVVSSGGTDDVLNRNGLGSSIDATILASGIQQVGGIFAGSSYGGGIASGTQVEADGSQTVVSGGVASSTTVDNEGEIIVGSGGSAVNLLDEGLAAISGAVTGATVASAAVLEVDGGTVDSLTVQSSGHVEINTGVVSGGVVSGGVLIGLNPGDPTSTLLPATVNVGYTASALALSVTDGTITLAAAAPTFSTGGYASGLSLGEGGVLIAGYRAVGTTVTSGGTVSVTSGATASYTTISAGGTVSVLSGGTAHDTTILTSGLEIVLSGGIESSGTISGQPDEALGGASAVYLQTAQLEVQSGGSAVLEQVTEGLLTVNSGGQVLHATVGVSGVADVAGFFYEATVSGTISIMSGGTGNGTGITSGSETVLDGGLELAGYIEAGQFTIDSGGSATEEAIVGGLAVVSSGGVLLQGGVQASGRLVVAGSALSTSIRNGGTMSITSGGLAVGTDIVITGQGIVFSGGVASFTLVSNGGEELVSSGGIADFTTVSSVGEQFVSSGGIANFTTVSSGGEQFVLLAGSASGTMVGSGGEQLVLFGGTATGTVVSSGGEQIVSSGGQVSFTTVSFGGQEIVSLGGVASFTTISAGGKVIVSSGGHATGTDILAGGKLDLRAITYASGGTATLDTSTDILTLTEGGNSTTEQLSGSYTGEYFHLTADASSGTVVSVNAIACYCRGTLIRTGRGEVAVEALQIGDRVLTVSGEARPIRWIGTRSYAGRFARMNPAVLPIRIQAGALADGVPGRDLLVSPQHAMFLDQSLIPAECLVNGTTIRRVEQVDFVEYYHLELDSHDVILAEGAPSETFVDDGGRGVFHNAAEYAVLYPDSSSGGPFYYASRVEGGFTLEAVRLRLAFRAGQTRAAG